MTDDIRIADAYENNLKHVSLTIPKGKLVVFAGVSGSGKSTRLEDMAFLACRGGWPVATSIESRSRALKYAHEYYVAVTNSTFLSTASSWLIFSVSNAARFPRRSAASSAPALSTAAKATSRYGKMT